MTSLQQQVDKVASQKYESHEAIQYKQKAEPLHRSAHNN